MVYICNITGKVFDLDDSEKNRESGMRFGYSSRFRALCLALSKSLYDGEVKIMTSIEVDKTIRGIGMSDGIIANLLEEKYDYTNTFFDCEPFLDIYNDTHVSRFRNLDFIISSDVFEHISPYPDLQIAFNNLYAMLKVGGSLVFSVPFSTGRHIEHFPNLYDYSVATIENEDGKIYHELYNTTRNNEEEVFKDLCFHGGAGSTLEMRVFSRSSVRSFLTHAGFIDINFHEITDELKEYGIFWGAENCSLVITARRGEDRELLDVEEPEGFIESKSAR